jgi:hypothetical protein
MSSQVKRQVEGKQVRVADGRPGAKETVGPCLKPGGRRRAVARLSNFGRGTRRAYSEKKPGESGSGDQKHLLFRSPAASRARSWRRLRRGPHGRQRGSQPLDILVECRGHLRPRRDQPGPPSRDGHHDYVRFAPDEPGSPRRASWAGRVATQTIRAVTSIMALPAGTRRRCSQQSRAHSASVKNGTSHGDHGRHEGHGGGHGANGGPVPTVQA